MVTRKCLETVGLFSPIFSHYGEDQNFCHRCTYHKFEIGVSPRVRAFHEREQVPGKDIKLKKMLERDKIYCFAVLLNLKHSLFRQWLFLLFVSLKNLILSIILLRFKKVFVFLSRVKMLIETKELVLHRNITKKTGAYLS